MNDGPMTKPLLEIKNLQIEFKLHAQGVVRAVDGVSFRVNDGASVALVGESGSGKSVTAQAILGILPSSARICAGEIIYTDPRTGSSLDLAKLDPSGDQFLGIRGGRISMIFQ